MQKSNYVSVDCKDLKGKLTVEPSKSMLHRYLICSFLSGNLSKAVDELASIENKGEDVLATIEALSAINKTCEQQKIARDEKVFIDCRDSGSTLRMILPIAGAIGLDLEIKLGDGLRKRPIDDLIEVLNRHGQIVKNAGGIINTKGKLRGGEYNVLGGVSSQYVSGLLFALPLLEEKSTLTIDGAISSRPYIDMTISSIEKFGIHVIRNKDSEKTGFIIEGKQTYVYKEGNENNFIEGDWSSGAMWLAAKKLSYETSRNVKCDIKCTVEIDGLNYDSIQGDRKIKDIFEMYDSTASVEETIDKTIDKTIEIDVDDIPDIVPAISLYACMQNCTTVLYNASRLRLKECDRLSRICDILKSIGADVLENEDKITIYGMKRDETGGRAIGDDIKYPGTDSLLRTDGDHRMIMLATFTSIITNKKAKVGAPEGIRKSYPSFFKDIERLGGKVCR